MAQTAASPAATDSGYVTVSDGVELYYERYGDTGEPLLLLHGGLLTSGLAFGAMIPTLVQNHQVILVDLEGHGRTALVDRDLSYEQMADDISTLLTELGVAQADVFGYSLGGGVALRFAIQHPDQVRKLILASTPFKTEGWAPEILGAMGSLNEEAAMAMQATPLYEAYAAVAPNPDDWPNLVIKVGQLQTAPENAYDWTEGVETLTIPVLLIAGDADSVLPEHTLAFFRLLGGGVIGDLAPLPAVQLDIIPGTNHSAVLLRTDLVLATVTSFLDAPLTAAGSPVSEGTPVN